MTEARAQQQRRPTLGEYRVGITFNPSGSPDVIALKQKAAAFIDECQRQWEAFVKAHPESPPQDKADLFMERSRLYRLAQDGVEGAAMWAVKAATKKPPV